MHDINVAIHIAQDAHAMGSYAALHVARWADPVMAIARSGTAQVCEHVGAALKIFAPKH